MSNVSNPIPELKLFQKPMYWFLVPAALQRDSMEKATGFGMAYAGNGMINVAPSASLDFTSSVPSWALRILYFRDNPGPVPWPGDLAVKKG